MRRLLWFLAGTLLLPGSAILGQLAVKNPHGKLQWDCQDCHSTESWSKMRDTLRFDHAATGFVLMGAHAAAQCIGCHKSPTFSNVGVTCIDCHTDHHNGQLGTDCQNCHTPRDWQNRRSTLELHSSMGFALTGAHAVADCEACHIGHARQEYAGTPMVCYDCHSEAYALAQEPNHAQAGFPLDCRVCHQAAAASWRNADYDHPASFPLIGGHRGVACKTCHVTSYSSLPVECYSCHSASFVSSTEPNHESSGFTHDCTLCHTINGWQPANYDHAATAFPLTGAHVQVNCASCHSTQYAGTPTACYACHQGNFDQTTEPDHRLAQFDQDCTTCHTTTAWQPSSFDHGSTSFALTGQHATQVCSRCHSTSFSGTPTACYGCHQSDFDGVSLPNHVQQGFDHDCTMCHTTSGWTPSSFNHAVTAFPLTGRHLEALCTSCHAGGYAGTPTDCYSCHQSNFGSAVNPNHVLANFSHDCTTCHTINGWTPSTFDHSVTGFTLTGAHPTVLCISCHAVGYAGTPTDCYSCHQTAYEQVPDPNHVSGNFDHNCSICHSTSAWPPSSIDHAATAFPLTGMHLTTACVLCHVTGYTGTPTACYACHQNTYESATNPNHVAGGFPTDCQTCHTTSGWTPSSFSHANTAFPLTGAHTSALCVSCHASGYAGTPTECYSCHQTAYEQVSDPNHVSGNFDHNCATCHSTTAWLPSSFNHATTAFPLTGRHLTTTCVSCHASGFTGTPTACYACHQSTYASTTNPSHAAANFPTDCQTCHTTSAWTPANWDHDGQYFPIYSGAHGGAWSVCSVCHVNAASFAVFECIDCHQHDKTGTDSRHSGVQNYQYVSTACYTCHPRGRT